MKKYQIITILFLVTIPILTVVNKNRISRTPRISLHNTDAEIRACKQYLPEADIFKKTTGEKNYYRAYKKTITDKTPAGFVFFTKDICPEIVGFSGTINIIAAILPDGTIKQAGIIEHNETPSYAFKINDFIKQFAGKNIHDNFVLGRNIDGITHATVTSAAITDSINAASKVILSDIEKNPPLSYLKHTGPNYSEIIIPVLLFALALASFLTKNARLKLFTITSSLIYLGIIKASMISIVHILNLILLKPVNLSSSIIVPVLLILTATSLVLVGNLYCGYICPFGALQEILSRILPLRKIKSKLKPSRKTDLFLRNVKYLILFFTLLLATYLNTSDVANFEVFVLLFTMNAGIIGWIFTGLMLLNHLLYSRFWCKYLCPVGAINGLIARFALFRIKINAKTCTTCLSCEKACPVNAICLDIRNPEINRAECILCSKCLSSCKTGAITFGIR